VASPAEAGGEPFEAELVVRQRNAWLLGITAFFGLLGFALTVLYFATGSPYGGWGPAVLFFSALAGVALVRENVAPVPVRVVVRADAGGLRVGDASVPRQDILDAQIVPIASGDFLVRVARRRALPLELVVTGPAEGRRVLRALGFDASQTAMRFRGLSRALAKLGMTSFVVSVGLFTVALLLALLRFESPPLVLALIAVGIPAGFAALAPTRIDVGADGVLLTWLGRRRFIPAGAILDVAWYASGGGKNRLIGARIRLRDGEVVWLPVGNKRWDDERVAALIERITEAKETHDRGHVASATALLGRGDRDLAAWITALRAIGTGASATLRTAPVPTDQLWRVVESPGENPEDRAAAAVALGSSADDAARHRLRVAAGAIADRDLRVAIDAVTEEDDAALEGALRDVTARSRSSPSP
jgi:hypothetical protein